MKKCHYGEKYTAEMCDHMKAGVKGIFSDKVVIYEGEVRRGLGDAIYMKSGKEKHLLNFCPFCGGELLNPSLFDEIGESK